MYQKIDDIVMNILTELKNNDYKKFNKYYIQFIDEFMMILSNTSVKDNKNLEEIGYFLQKLNEGYQYKDFVQIWDLFRYEYWTLNNLLN